VDLIMQVVRREQSSKFANAIEPMRRRRAAFRRLSAHRTAGSLPCDVSLGAAAPSHPDKAG